MIMYLSFHWLMRNLNLRDFEVFPYEFVGIFSPISSQSMHNFFLLHQCKSFSKVLRDYF